MVFYINEVFVEVYKFVTGVKFNDSREFENIKMRRRIL